MSISMIRILKLGLLFINYIICLVGCRNTILLKYVSVWGMALASVIVLCGSVVLSNKYVNVVYNGIYVLLMLILICDKNVPLSEVTIFTILVTIVIIAIFCWYLHIYENKILKIVSKGGDVTQISYSYKKQVISLAAVAVISWVALMIVHYALENVSAKFITYLYGMNVIFSIPAMIGFILTMAISIFVFLIVSHT